FVPTGDTVLEKGDLVRVIAPKQREAELDKLFGEKIQNDLLNAQTEELKQRKILITNKRLEGKSLQNLELRKSFNVNVTRVFRSGVELVATADLVLHIGDKVKIVGSEENLSLVEKFLGNSVKHLNEPHLSTIFAGIFLGIIVGYIPIAFPGMPQPAKLGLAGGPLIVSLLMGAFGHKIGLTCYTTQSANLMLREIGISLFLACVGLEAGEHFFDTLINGDGLLWVGYGLLITMIPVLIIGCIARKVFHLNYFTIVGMISGTNTNPPALYYSNMIAENDRPSVAYSTVYPLAMFLRIVLAQTLILVLW
ncbi:MAG: transporter, partial [Salinivirgaceae bacterium]|nr:transporter [Salinivirgaceae bacterium]